MRVRVVVARLTVDEKRYDAICGDSSDAVSTIGDSDVMELLRNSVAASI